MLPLNFFLAVLLVVLGCVDTQWSRATVKKCIAISNYLATFGDGSTSTSCMGCDPALPECTSPCQSVVDDLYTDCDGICLPDGYYYDPCKTSLSFTGFLYVLMTRFPKFIPPCLLKNKIVSTVTGCWADVKPTLKIGVERCGCDAAPRASTIILTLVITLTGVVSWSLM